MSLVSKNDIYVAQATEWKIHDIASSYFFGKGGNEEHNVNSLIINFILSQDNIYQFDDVEMDFDKYYQVISLFNCESIGYMSYNTTKDTYVTANVVSVEKWNVYGFVNRFIKDLLEEFGDKIFDKRFNGYYRNTHKKLKSSYQQSFEEHCEEFSDKVLVQSFVGFLEKF